MASTAVAMSGGGHRACIFALGVALYLADAQRIGDIASMASVSGGSLANGALAQDLDLKTCSASDVEAAVARTARKVAGRGTLFGAKITIAYVAGLVALTAAVAAGPWLLPIATWLKLLVFLGGVLILAWTANLRGRVCARAYGKTLFSPTGKPTRLADIHAGVDHVICATDLHAGENVYFSARFVCSYRFGFGTPGDLPLHSAVQASAAFPGAFPVAWLRCSRFGFSGGRPEAAGTRSLALVDGGVYDNMADQWAHGMSERQRRPGGSAQFQDADELIVVSASAGLGFGALWPLHLPVLGELLTLVKDKSVLYDDGNSVRREWLVDRFDTAERDGNGLRGALVHIVQSPYRVPELYASGRGAQPSPQRAERAHAALDALQRDLGSSDWAEIAKANASVPTTLLGLNKGATARLLYHAYVLAMVNLHVLLCYPLLAMPRRARFEQLLG
jgi:predicted acylesterase/phospholipase RssA